jgi:hypothetical protein
MPFVTLTNTDYSRSMHKILYPLRCLYQRTSPALRPLCFYGKELLASCPNPKLEDSSLSVVCDCLFNIIAATLHMCKPILHPQLEKTLCHTDRDPLTTYHLTVKINYGFLRSELST